MQSTLNQKVSLANILGKALGILWLIDGLLQLQPKMFGADFINNVLAPNLSGQPGFMRALIDFGIRVFSFNIATANWIAALLQIAIGVLLLFPIAGKKFKAGLYLSIVWGLIVWIFGEGLGNLLTGSASFYTGAPGSALVYALIATFLLMPEKIDRKFFAKIAAAILFMGAALQLQLMFWNSDGTQTMFQLSASDPVHAINSLPAIISNSLSAHPIEFNWLLIILPLLLAIALWLKPNKTTAATTIIFLFFVWWLGQDFGGLSTIWLGTATDPNTAPLIMLLVLPLFLRNDDTPRKQD